MQDDPPHQSLAPGSRPPFAAAQEAVAAPRQQDRTAPNGPSSGPVANSAWTSSAHVQRRVVIVERFLTHYRVAFYESLRSRMSACGLDLVLLVGEATTTEKSKKDAGVLPWALPLPTHYLFGNRLCWQPFGRHAADADLVIVLHENKLLYNLWLMFVRRPRRLAFWGHGRNLQSRRPDGVREVFKRWTIGKVDWWFAYTDMTAQLIRQAGFPEASTTVVENAIDTACLAGLCRQVDAAALAAFRKQHRLHEGPLGLFIGSLYQEKRLEFLFSAALRIKARVPGFQLLIAGAGPQRGEVEAVSRRHDWIHYAGPLQGADKATALVLADVLLNPGLVGLGILDAFVGGIPIFTTDCGLHSPEIAYLDSGRNGIMTANDEAGYADAVVAALRDPQAMQALRAQATASAARYTIDNMSRRFCDGVLACLERA
jgi:glycosyltransferase involved in cell wall biosynthesis